MSKSIVTENARKCYFCGSVRGIEIHHVFGGAYRRKSDQLGLVVPLCHYCHNEPPDGVHFNRHMSDALKEEVQILAMRAYGWDTERFIQEFGKNYIKGD